MFSTSTYTLGTGKIGSIAQFSILAAFWPNFNFVNGDIRLNFINSFNSQKSWPEIT